MIEFAQWTSELIQESGPSKGKRYSASTIKVYLSGVVGTFNCALLILLDLNHQQSSAGICYPLTEIQKTTLGLLKKSFKVRFVLTFMIDFSSRLTDRRIKAKMTTWLALLKIRMTRTNFQCSVFSCSLILNSTKSWTGCRLR